LTEAIEVRAKWVVREVPLPEAWGEQVDLGGGMGIDAFQHVHEVDIRIDESSRVSSVSSSLRRAISKHKTTTLCKILRKHLFLS
jgi:hypothetical protein